MQAIQKSERLEVYKPQYKTSPRVYYKNLYRFTRCFIAGSTAFKNTDECAEEARVSLSKGTHKQIAEVRTNNYGDFKIDNLEENSGEYNLKLEYPGYNTQELTVDLKTSIDLGVIFL